MRMKLTRDGVWLAWLCAMAALAQERRVPNPPTPRNVVEGMLQMARVTGSDYVIDLGSGDGRILAMAPSQFGARGFGVHINPARALFSMTFPWWNGSPMPPRT
jgi:hypothetical protein